MFGAGSALYWARKIPASEWKNPWLAGNSLEASTAAWGLRAMLSANLIDEAVPVARYLLQALGPKDQDPDVVKNLIKCFEKFLFNGISVTISNYFRRSYL